MLKIKFNQAFLHEWNHMNEKVRMSPSLPRLLFSMGHQLLPDALLLMVRTDCQGRHFQKPCGTIQKHGT